MSIAVEVTYAIIYAEGHKSAVSIDVRAPEGGDGGKNQSCPGTDRVADASNFTVDVDGFPRSHFAPTYVELLSNEIHPESHQDMHDERHPNVSAKLPLTS